jgi:membrane associated rhomboid family serine protease
MALADRDYMRDEDRVIYHTRPPRSATIILMAVIGAVFLAQNFFPDAWWEQLTLSADKFWTGAVWQLLTFQFLHGGLLHLAGNLLGLWSFGRALEWRLGQRRMLLVYFVSGVAGGLLQAMLGALAPAQFGAQHLLGASAGVCGLFAAFALLEPEADVLWFFVPMRARTMYLVSVVVAVTFAIAFRDSHIAHAAHLGGLLAGAAFIRWQFRPRRPIQPAAFTPPPGWFEKIPAPRDPQDDAPEEFISRQVDPILEKISAHGLHSLTDRERKTLEAAREKMERR